MDELTGTAPEPVTAPEPATAPEPVTDRAEPATKPDAPAKSLSIRDAIAKAKEQVSKAVAGDAPGRDRDEQGRFKAAEGATAPQSAAPPAKAPETPAKPSVEAPSRFSADAKAAWGTTPDPVKAEISRAMKEMETGLSEYQKRFEPLKPYQAMAEREGTTIEAALQNYVRMATALRQSPEQAIAEVFQYAGINPQQWAAKVAGAAPNETAVAMQNSIAGLQRELAEARREAETFKAQMAEREEREAASQIEQFKANAPRFDELRNIMAWAVETGLASTIQEAYTYAERLNPAPAQTVSQAPAPAQPPQPRRASPQISGSPANGSNPASRGNQPRSIRDSIRAARSVTGV